MIQISNVFFLLRYFYSNGLNLFRNFNGFGMFVAILVFQDFYFVMKAVDDVVLTCNLSFIVALELGDAYFKGFLSSPKLFDVCFQHGEVSLIDLVRLDFLLVTWDDSVTDALAHHVEVLLFLLLVLSSLVLGMLSLISLFPMLLVETKWVDNRLGRLLLNWWVTSFSQRCSSFDQGVVTTIIISVVNCPMLIFLLVLANLSQRLILLMMIIILIESIRILISHNIAFSLLGIRWSPLLMVVFFLSASWLITGGSCRRS